MDEGDKQNWIAIVYSDGEKIDSRLFCAMSEKKANKMSQEWLNRVHAGRDLSLHHIIYNSDS